MFIYRIFNKTNHKNYIGQCVYDKFHERYAMNEWWNDTDNKYLIEDYKLYGKDAFLVEILLEDINSENILSQLEIFYIDKFDSMTPNGYNQIKPKVKGKIYKLKKYTKYSKPYQLVFEKAEVLDLPNEVWKDVVGYEGLYMVSNLARIKGLDRLEHRKTYSRRRKGQIMSQHVDNWGYSRTNLTKNGKMWSWHIHKLVALAFCSNPNNLLQVNHIDGNKLNNNPSNLEWCDQYHNMQHAFRTGLQISGEKHWRAKLTLGQVQEIRKIYKESDIKVTEIAKLFNINVSTIHGILKGRIWRHY